MSYFLKLIGTSEDPLPADWMQTRREVLRGVRFGQKPPTHKGDLIVYYAVGRKRLCGLLRVASEEPTRENPDSEPWTEGQKRRWRWWIKLLPIVTLPADESAPHVDDVGFDATRVRRKSYVPLAPEEFRRMEKALRQADARRKTRT
jgi:hypothetical protein